MKAIKQYLITIYENGSISTDEVLSPELSEVSKVKEIVMVSNSWDKYNLITYSKRSKLYEEIQKIKEEYINIEFLGRSFEGKIDRKIGRIYGLKNMMNFSRIEQMNFKTGNSVSLEFDKGSKVLKIEQI